MLSGDKKLESVLSFVAPDNVVEFAVIVRLVRVVILIVVIPRVHVKNIQDAGAMIDCVGDVGELGGKVAVATKRRETEKLKEYTEACRVIGNDFLSAAFECQGGSIGGMMFY